MRKFMENFMHTLETAHSRSVDGFNLVSIKMCIFRAAVIHFRVYRKTPSGAIRKIHIRNNPSLLSVTNIGVPFVNIPFIKTQFIHCLKNSLCL